MIKFQKAGKVYWVGHNSELGYLIFNPEMQRDDSGDQVTLYVVDRRQSSSFNKAVVRKNLTDKAKLDIRACERVLMPYVEERRKKLEYALKNMRSAHCYRCHSAIASTVYTVCDSCGWIRCSCGACGCGYGGH